MANETSSKASKPKSDISFMNSIKTRLIAVMLGIAIIPLVIAIGVSYKTSTDKAMQDAQDSMEWQAWYIEARFAAIVDYNMNMIRQVGENPTVIAYLESPEAGIGDDVIMNTLQSVDDVLADGNATTLTGPDGVQIMRTDGGKLVDVCRGLVVFLLAHQTVEDVEAVEEEVRVDLLAEVHVAILGQARLLLVLERPRIDAHGVLGQEYQRAEAEHVVHDDARHEVFPVNASGK